MFKKLQKLLKRILEAEQKLIGKKTSQVNNKEDDWWDFQYSGWAMGGREMFAQTLCDILQSLDEQKLASSATAWPHPGHGFVSCGFVTSCKRSASRASRSQSGKPMAQPRSRLRWCHPRSRR